MINHVCESSPWLTKVEVCFKFCFTWLEWKYLYVFSLDLFTSIADLECFKVCFPLECVVSAQTSIAYNDNSRMNTTYNYILLKIRSTSPTFVTVIASWMSQDMKRTNACQSLQLRNEKIALIGKTTQFLMINETLITRIFICIRTNLLSIRKYETYIYLHDIICLYKRILPKIYRRLKIVKI